MNRGHLLQRMNLSAWLVWKQLFQSLKNWSIVFPDHKTWFPRLVGMRNLLLRNICIQTYIGKFEIPMCDIDQLNFKIYWDWGGNLKVETLVYMFTITISRNLGQTNLGWSLTQCDYTILGERRQQKQSLVLKLKAYQISLSKLPKNKFMSI